MAVGETILVGFAIGLCLFFAWIIGHRGGVDAIAGYQKRDLPPQRERELATDIRNLLVGVAVLLSLTIIDAWTGSIPYDGIVVLLLILLLVGWIIWKYN